MLLLTDFTNVNRVSVALLVGKGVRVLRVFPRLGQEAVVPDVALVREYVGDEPHLRFPVKVELFE